MSEMRRAAFVVCWAIGLSVTGLLVLLVAQPVLAYCVHRDTKELESLSLSELM